MIEAGILDGLSRGGVSSTPVTLAKVPRTADSPEIATRTSGSTPVKLLLAAGFVKLGDWVADQNGRLALSVPAPREPGVYAFVTDGLVRYVGLTRVGFDKRMGNYRVGHVRQRTSHRINGIIFEHIGSGTVVEIYLAMPPALEWNGLPVNAAAGLEAGLIEMIQPPWNKMGVSAVQ